VSEIFDYNADSPPYYWDRSPVYDPSFIRPLAQLPPVTPPPTAVILRSPLQILADAASSSVSAPSQFPTSPSSSVTPYTLLSSSVRGYSLESDDFPETTDGPQTPVSPIDYNRVADGLPAIDDIVFPATAPSPVRLQRITSPRPLPPLPNNASLENQENRIPLPDFSDPRCTEAVVHHPHQYIAITTPRRPEWRPEDELILDHAIHLPTAEELIDNPPRFPTVTPFRNAALHVQRIHPYSQPLTHACFIPPIAVCSKAARTPSNRDFPLGLIAYNFSASIVDTFARYPPTVQAAFENCLVILEVVDLLDGRHITTYGYLKFEGSKIYVKDQTYHCEDFIRTFPQLLAYTFTPRIPADPFTYLRVHPDDLALSTA
jgi:hypothetical protein